MARRRGGPARPDAAARPRHRAVAGRRGAGSKRQRRRRVADRATATPRIWKRDRPRRWRWAASATGVRRRRSSPRSPTGSSPWRPQARWRASATRTRSSALIGLLATPDAAIRQAVIAALNSIGHPGDAAPHRPSCSTDPDPTVRESALKIAGYFGYPACLDRVLACCQDAAESVRRTAVEQLPFFDDARVSSGSLRHSTIDAPPVRAAAAHGARARRASVSSRRAGSRVGAIPIRGSATWR